MTTIDGAVILKMFVHACLVQSFVGYFEQKASLAFEPQMMVSDTVCLLMSDLQARSARPSNTGRWRDQQRSASSVEKSYPELS